MPESQKSLADDVQDADGLVDSEERRYSSALPQATVQNYSLSIAEKAF
jgi:hypothetical protein